MCPLFRILSALSLRTLRLCVIFPFPFPFPFLFLFPLFSLPSSRFHSPHETLNKNAPPPSLSLHPPQPSPPLRLPRHPTPHHHRLKVFHRAGHPSRTPRATHRNPHRHPRRAQDQPRWHPPL